MKVAWTGIKLVWKDGINFLYKWWLWIKDKVMSAWDAAVHELTKTFVSYFVKPLADMFPDIHIAWRKLTKSIVDDWDWASTQIAKGLAWIYAKLTGLDADAMIRIVEEDHIIRKNQRDEQFKNDMAEMGKHSAGDWLEKKQQERDAAYADKQDARQKAYDAQLEQMQVERLQAEQEFNDAVAEAMEARADFEKDAVARSRNTLRNEEFPDIAEAIAEAIEEAVVDSINTVHKTISAGSTGTFNVKALRQHIGRTDDPIMQVVANTSQTNKLIKQQNQIQRRGIPAIVR